MNNCLKRAPFAESDAWLLYPPNYCRMWMIFVNVIMKEPDMSSRTLPDDMSIIFARAGFATFPFRDGSIYILPEDIDYVLAGNDPEFRSLRHYLESTPDGGPNRFSRKPQRLRLLNLYAKLKCPRFVRHLEP